MKTEITLVVAVLASGFAAIFMLAQSETLAFQPANFLQITSAPHAPVVARKVSTPQDVERVAKSNIASPDFDTNHNDLIKRAAHALNHSVPLTARIRYKINLFGESISGPGRYLQKGQGTRLTRLQFEFGIDQSAVEFHQFCDGDNLYTLSIAGDKQNLEFVDLRQLDALQQEVTTSSRVKNWLSVGSLTGLMEQLSMHFDFTEVKESTLDSIPVIVCTGQWKSAALQRLLEGQTSANAAQKEKVHWQHLPKHLPHRVRLTLGVDQRFPYFPYRVVFEQFEMVDGSQITNEIAVLELFEVKQDLNLSDEMFSIPTLESMPEDATEWYRDRIKQFTR